MIMSVVCTVDNLWVHWGLVSHLQGKGRAVHDPQERDEY